MQSKMHKRLFRYICFIHILSSPFIIIANAGKSLFPEKSILPDANYVSHDHSQRVRRSITLNSTNSGLRLTRRRADESKETDRKDSTTESTGRRTTPGASQHDQANASSAKWTNMLQPIRQRSQGFFKSITRLNSARNAHGSESDSTERGTSPSSHASSTSTDKDTDGGNCINFEGTSYTDVHDIPIKALHDYVWIKKQQMHDNSIVGKLSRLLNHPGTILAHLLVLMGDITCVVGEILMTEFFDQSRVEKYNEGMHKWKALHSHDHSVDSAIHVFHSDSKLHFDRIQNEYIIHSGKFTILTLLDRTNCTYPNTQTTSCPISPIASPYASHGVIGTDYGESVQIHKTILKYVSLGCLFLFLMEVWLQQLVRLCEPSADLYMYDYGHEVENGELEDGGFAAKGRNYKSKLKATYVQAERKLCCVQQLEHGCCCGLVNENTRCFDEEDCDRQLTRAKLRRLKGGESFTDYCDFMAHYCTHNEQNDNLRKWNSFNQILKSSSRKTSGICKWAFVRIDFLVMNVAFLVEIIQLSQKYGPSDKIMMTVVLLTRLMRGLLCFGFLVFHHHEMMESKRSREFLLMHTFAQNWFDEKKLSAGLLHAQKERGHFSNRGNDRSPTNEKRSAAGDSTASESAVGKRPSGKLGKKVVV